MSLPGFREQTRSWHERKRSLDELEQELDSSPLSAEDVDALMGRTALGLHRAVRLLDRRFGVDANTSPPQLLRPGQEPQSDEDWALYMGAIGSVIILTKVLARLRDEVMPLPPAERGAATVRIALWAARDLIPEQTAHFTRTDPSPRLAEATASTLTGFVRGLISTRENQRLRGYLVEEAANLDGGTRPAQAWDSRSWEKVFERDLPGAVWATLHEVGVQGRPAAEGDAHESWDVDAFRNAVASSLERQRHPERVESLSEGRVVSPSAEQEFLARQITARDEERVAEERQAFRELFAAAKLSPQQAAILERRYIDRLTNEQIAEDLGITRDQINPQRSRAFEKLRAFCEHSGIDASLIKALEEAG